MQSVGIMSMQRIFNYGSSLQAYALRRILETLSRDVRVSFIDYEPGETLVSIDPPSGRVRRVLNKLREYNNVESNLSDKLKFFNHKRTYADKYFPLIGVPPSPERCLDVDVQVIGSDEVFNCVQTNANVGYSRDLFGHGSRAKKIVSYAGSFGNTTIEKIRSASIADELAEDFARFDAISVRDANSASVVKSLTGTDPEIHLDPTLIFDFNRDTENNIPKERQRDDKYIIVYGYSGRLGAEENRSVRAYASSIGAKVLAFGGLQGAADEFIDCDPFTLLAYFRDAEAVVTDTFHGTIFSIINEVPFATIIRPSTGHKYGNEEKLIYLLKMLGLDSRALRPDIELASLLDESVNYAAARQVREHERERTKRYLHRVLLNHEGA